MHCWQYVALCKTCKPDLNVSELKGLSRNDLFSYISFHMTRVEFNKLYDNRLSWRADRSLDGWTLWLATESLHSDTIQSQVGEEFSSASQLTDDIQQPFI